jgi:hypothetical protein
MAEAPDRLVGYIDGAEDDWLASEGRPAQLPLQGGDFEVMGMASRLARWFVR